MSIAYLNGIYLPLAEARISPLDRGFLFGDGVYEVIPCHHGRMVGFSLHIERLHSGLNALKIQLGWSIGQWREVCEQLLTRNPGDHLAIYLQVSRGADQSRGHAYPADIEPTRFGFTMEIAAPPLPDPALAVTYSAITAPDLRWKRCHIKSTSLLGNVMHFNEGLQGGNTETILYNSAGELTEASACNVYAIKNGTVATPPLSEQILAGVTRTLLLRILNRDGAIAFAERPVTLAELRDADEVWLSSSTKELAPVTEVDGEPVGNGQVGEVWRRAQGLFSQHRHDHG